MIFNISPLSNPSQRFNYFVFANNNDCIHLCIALSSVFFFLVGVGNNIPGRLISKLPNHIPAKTDVLVSVNKQRIDFFIEFIVLDKFERALKNGSSYYYLGAKESKRHNRVKVPWCCCCILVDENR